MREDSFGPAAEPVVPDQGNPHDENGVEPASGSVVGWFPSEAAANANDVSVQRGGWQVRMQSGLPLAVRGVEPKGRVASLPSRFAKRGFDLLLALTALIGLSPVLIAIAIAVKATSPGPALFVQERVGRNNRSFRILKFRTMRSDAGDSSGVQQTSDRHDPRITPVGRMLRQTSLDELPQLINILMGDMSFVGPRPHVPGMLAGGRRYEELVPYYRKRHMVRPGLTGWAQVNGYRGPTTNAQLATARVDHDMAYIQNRSLWLDVLIIVKTGWRELRRGSGF